MTDREVAGSVNFKLSKEKTECYAKKDNVIEVSIDYRRKRKNIV